jgi:ABC-2 type transport system permease protein
MSLRESVGRTATLFRQNVELLLRDPAPIIITTAMPLIIIAFLKGTGLAVLRQAGFTGVNGAEVIVPGQVVMWALFGVAFLVTAFFAEHRWGTWDRLRASAARPAEVLLGKLLPSTLLVLLQMCVLFAIGVLAFGMHVRGSWMGLGLMVLVSTAFTMALAMLLVAMLRTVNQATAVVNVGAMALAGLGGAFAPVEALPGWAQTVAPFSPAYWMIKGLRGVVLEGASLGVTLRPAAVVLGMTIGVAIVALWRFRFTDEKTWED